MPKLEYINSIDKISSKRKKKDKSSTNKENSNNSSLNLSSIKALSEEE